MSTWRPWTTFALSLFGIGVSIYLTLIHFEGVRLLVCPGDVGGTHGVIDCTAVLTSSQSTLFGIFPVAVVGLGYFVVMSAINNPWAWRSTSLYIAWARLILVIGGMGMVLYLISVELLQVHSICIWCTSIHAVTFLLFILTITGWEDTGWAISSYNDAVLDEPAYD